MRTRNIVPISLVALTALGGAAQAQEESLESKRGAQAVGSHVSTLSPVVVTATASERDLADTPASVSVIAGETLRRRPVLDLADAVKDTVGVSLESMGLGRRGISIRGMSAEHTLMLVDGQRVNSSASAIAHSDYELGWVPTAAIERVEVVRGPLSSLYGSEALGGVVNTVTRSATDTWEGSFSSYALISDHSLGGNQFKNGFYLGGPLVPGRLGMNAWGELVRRQPLSVAGNTALTALDERRAKTGHLGLSWTPDSQQRIDVSMDAGNEKREGVRGGTSGAIYSSQDDVQRRRYALSHTGHWRLGDSQIRLYSATLDRRNQRSDGNTQSGPNKFIDTVLDGRMSFPLGSVHTLTVGGETRHESLRDPSVNRKGKKTQVHDALFVQDEIRLSQQWQFVLGSRLDRHEVFGSQVSPRAYVIFQPDETLAFKAGVGKGFKAPTLKQLSPEYESRAAMGGRGIIRGNPNLQPETNQAFELGAEFKQGPWSASATLFHNDVKNLIDTVRQPTCFEPRRVCLDYQNVDKVRLQGVELAASTDLSDRWHVNANYTYLDARDRASGDRLAERARHRANATLEWDASEKLSTRLRVEYTGSQYRSAIETNRPGYALWHWYLDYDLNKTVSLYAGIENLTDRRLSNDDVSLYSDADEGRRYFVGLTARY